MINVRYMILLSAFSGLISATGSDASAATKHHQVHITVGKARHILSVPEFTIDGSCTGAGQPAPKPSKAIRINIDDKFEIRKPVRDIVLKGVNQTSDNEDSTAGSPFDSDVSALYQTRFDLDLSQYLAKNGDVILIKIVVLDHTLKLFPYPFGVTGTDKQSKTLFCGMKQSDENGNEVAIFLAKYVSGNAVNSFNIDLLVPEVGTKYYLPLVIDPKVKNNG